MEISSLATEVRNSLVRQIHKTLAMLMCNIKAYQTIVPKIHFTKPTNPLKP